MRCHTLSLMTIEDNGTLLHIRGAQKNKRKFSDRFTNKWTENIYANEIAVLAESEEILGAMLIKMNMIMVE